MSLAASLASDGMRPASFLPAVKCSDCGHEIEISAMGEHICPQATKPEPPAANPYQPTPYQSNPYQSDAYQPKTYQSNPYKANPYESVYMSNPFDAASPPVSPPMPSGPMNANGFPATSPLQYSQPVPQASPQPPVQMPAIPVINQPRPTRNSRPSLPRINPNAANMPFLPKPTRTDSPISPAMSSRSGGSMSGRPSVMRGATSPMPRTPGIFDLQPPSPEFSANLDCAFPPFPTSSNRPSTSRGRKTTSEVPSRKSSRQDSRMGNDFENNNTANEDGSYRVDTPTDMAYDGSRQRPIEHEIPKPLDRQQGSFSNPNHINEVSPIASEPMPSRPSTSGSNGSRPLTAGSNFSRPGAPVPLKVETVPYRPERPSEDTVLSPRFLDQFSNEPTTILPLEPTSAPAAAASAERNIPAPLAFPARGDSIAGDQDRQRRPSLSTVIEDPANAPRPQFRARSSSRSAPRFDFRMDDAPPVPRPVQQYRQNSGHTPSESGSSTMSSFRSNNSSVRGSSPGESPASSVDIMSPLSSVASSQQGDDDRMRVAGLSFQQHKSKPSMRNEEPGLRAEQPSSKSPPRNVAKPAPTSGPMQSADPTSAPGYNPSLESPMDPALQNRRIMEPNYNAGNTRPPLGRTATAPLPDRNMPHSPMPPLPETPLDGPFETSPDETDRGMNTPGRNRSRSNAAPPQQTGYNNPGAYGMDSQLPPPPPIPQETNRQYPVARRPSISTRKPPCRGCGLQIEGKSVKAADGRLTGRWHKACFTCKTCNEPFTTADFYVIDNQPYCEQHYHEKNGSLCHGCHRGIEGSYLETTSSTAIGTVDRKFHPRCFTCVDCRLVLSDDYFEIHGRVYCERHALAAMRVQQGRMANIPGGLNPARPNWTAERRTTKLMMM
ncbi:Hypothetical protein R9X50_00526400 [Acrodontium crateriforme]|uniref:LIM zinc-binding domain-containing protein n=1 Tax=Acrodontium crateriforme TaxID=150365 RepID=A0AAQ3RAR2_9PEZI|nr:Hypothetical protein R9X50_00526400 [Acrodontium crateriforme]